MPGDAYVSANDAMIGSNNGLMCCRRQAITWANASLSSIWP